MLRNDVSCVTDPSFERKDSRSFKGPLVFERKTSPTWKGPLVVWKNGCLSISTRLLPIFLVLSLKSRGDGAVVNDKFALLSQSGFNVSTLDLLPVSGRSCEAGSDVYGMRTNREACIGRATKVEVDRTRIYCGETRQDS